MDYAILQFEMIKMHVGTAPEVAITSDTCFHRCAKLCGLIASQTALLIVGTTHHSSRRCQLVWLGCIAMHNKRGKRD